MWDLLAKQKVGHVAKHCWTNISVLVTSKECFLNFFKNIAKKLSFSHNAYTMWPNRTKLFSEQSSNVWEVNDVCHVWPGFRNTLLSSKSLSVACWKMLTILSWKYNAVLTQVLLNKKQCIKILRQMIAFQRLLGE